MAASELLLVTLFFAAAAYLRLAWILPSKTNSNHNGPPKTGPSSVVIVLGSGGHTGEMMSLMRDIDPTRYKQRTYLISSGDDFSCDRAFDIEKRIQAKFAGSDRRTAQAGDDDSLTGIWDLKMVPRARKIHQPLYTTPISALLCLMGCFKALYQSARDSKIAPGQYPDLIVTNGPATAVMVIFAATVLKFLGLAPVGTMKILYVESWARIKTLSLSGVVLLKLGLCDKFVVQWETLSKAINGSGTRPKVEHCGFLVE